MCWHRAGEVERLTPGHQAIRSYFQGISTPHWKARPDTYVNQRGQHHLCVATHGGSWPPFTATELADITSNYAYSRLPGSCRLDVQIAFGCDRLRISIPTPKYSYFDRTLGSGFLYPDAQWYSIRLC